ncbi:U32 family peptidase [bacterium]|nr:U32 family peptidase [bacterium]
MIKKKPELVMPAGDLTKAEYAYKYGADACYCGLAKYSLRKAEVDFTIPQIKKAITLAHNHGKKLYVTFNVFAKNNYMASLKKDIKEISKLGPDAFIIADPGIVHVAKNSTKTPIHISTQANTTNAESIKFWKDYGIKRVVLARELTLREITEIKKQVPKMEIEVFAHGAMCISYSGRCLLSAAMTGREANQGDCAQPCRWKYKLYMEEELRPGQFFPVSEDDTGTYIFNSKDLRLLEFLPQLTNAGIDAFKVEGRNKTENYLATIANAYRKAIDNLGTAQFKKQLPELLAETEKIAHREYTSGFIFGDATKGETYSERSPVENYKFLGLNNGNTVNSLKFIPKNQIKVGDKIEILTTENVFHEKIEKMYNIDGENIKVANPHPEQNIITVKTTNDYPSYSIIRKRVENDKQRRIK